MMRYYDYSYGFMGMGLGLLLFLTFIALLVVVIILAARYMRRPGNTVFHPSYGKSLDILNERYARGEITEEEYKKIKAEIMK